MKKNILLFIAVFSVVIAAIGFKQKNQTGKFYYAFNEKKILTPHATKLIVRFSGKYSLNTLKQNISRIASTSTQKWLSDSQTVIIDAKESGIQSNLLNTFSIDNNVVSVNPIYTIDKGAEMGITNEFAVQFLDNFSQNSIDSLNKTYNVTIVKRSFYYLLRVPPKSDVLKIANTYYETGFAKFSHPNFIMQVTPFHIPNDTYFNEQWNFYNTGQTINDGHIGTNGADIKATQAWDITEGSPNITIAVLDEGVTSNHPDLPNTRQVRLNGSNFADGNANDPSPNGTVDNHGNACAGLIAATQDNNEGITGLAPNCKIMPIKVFNGDESGIADNLLADAITFAYTNGADIISNSWGFSGVTDPNAVPVIVTAIQNATTQGRYINGTHYGCVVAFSVGNYLYQPGYISFPACVNIPGVLSVGASDRYDEQAAYSPTSDPNSNQNQLIDVVAPSHRAYPEQISTETFEIWSLDMPGDNYGYNPWSNAEAEHPPITGEILPNTGSNYYDYTGRFGGTSAACPQVAGLAALILSVNPNFTQQQVYDIITSTADKVGGYSYNSSGFSNELGYGRINACAAVTHAFVSGLSISGDNTFCTTSNNYTIPNLPSGASVTWSVAPAYATVNTPNAQQTTLTKQANGIATLTATISNVCGGSPIVLNKSNIVVGTGSNITGTYNSPSNPAETMLPTPPPPPPPPKRLLVPVINPACLVFGTNVSVLAGSTVTWNITVDPGVVWGQGGNNIWCDFTALNQVVYFTATVTNSCGSYDVLYIFQCTTLNTCGIQPQFVYQPETESRSVTLLPNPANNTVTITSANTETTTITGSKKSAASKTTAPETKTIIKQVRMFDVSGRLMKQVNYSTPQQQVNIDVAALQTGIYFVIISDGKNLSYKKMFIQR